MSNTSGQPTSTIVAPINDTAASPTISWGGSLQNKSGTGIYGDYASVSVSVAGSLVGAFSASGFTGTVTGTASLATLASTVTVTTQTASATYYPVFVTANSTGAKAVSVGPMTYNPNTGALTTTTFVGAVTGNVTGTASLATQITVTSKSDNVEYFLNFAATNSTASKDINIGPATYNPSTSTLTATSFVGALTGNATSSNGTISIAAANTETINATGAVSVTKYQSNIAGDTGYAVTLAAPSTVGQIKAIELISITSGTVTLALSNVVGARAANGDAASTTCTFTNATDSLILISTATKWVYLGGSAVCT